MLNIAMFTNTYLPHVGGVARSVQSFSEALRRMGYGVHVIAPQFEGAEESTEHVYRVPALPNFNGTEFSVRLPQPFVISDFIDQLQPQVIHSHHPFLLGDAALRTAYERQLPLIFTHHTLYEEYTHNLPFSSDAIKRVAIQLATEYCNLCHHVIAPSDSIHELLRQRGVTVPITTIPTGIDLEAFDKGNGPSFRARHGIPVQAPLIGHVGRLSAEKNLGFLADSVAQYLRDHPECHFLIVGEGADEEMMRQRLEEHTAPEQIHFVGKQMGPDLADAYASMDLFVFASQSETQGLVVAEALAAGNPTVALDGPGVREIVCERNGVLLPSDATPQEFADAMKRLMSNPDHRRQLSEQAVQSAQPFGMPSCVKKLAGVYELMAAEMTRGQAETNGVWDQILGRLEAEWMLLSQKASALTAAVVDTDATRATIDATEVT